MRKIVQRLLHVTFGTKITPRVIERGPLNINAGKKPPNANGPIINPSRIVN